MTDAAQHRHRRVWYKRPPVWILAALVAGFAAYALLGRGQDPVRIGYSEFLDQVDAGNVSNVTFVGLQIDGHFKQPVARANAAGGAALTTFHARAPDFGDPALLPALRRQHVAIDAASSNWSGLAGLAVLGALAAFLLAKPMLLIIVAAFVAGLVRVARGGTMDVRAILSMLPMFRTLSAHGDKEKDVGGDSPRADNR